MEKERLLKLRDETKKLTVLYVEDDENIYLNTIKILQKFFEDENIIFAKDGEEGLSKFNENYIDLIISDINMPKLSGIDMLKEIRKLDHKVPIIFTSAHNELEYYQNAVDLHVTSYILKPISVTKLIDTIAQIVEEKVEEKITNENLAFLKSSNEKLIDIGYNMANEQDYDKILWAILIGAKDLSNADGGTLYLYDKDENTLEFTIALNTSLDMQFHNKKDKVGIPPIQLQNEDGSQNRKNVSAVSAIDDKLININDIYTSTTYDFTGAKNFDTTNGYKTTSMLVIPMKDRNNELVGVLQLINKIDKDEQIVNFDSQDEALIFSMSAQATMTLQNNQLVKDLESLLYALVKSVGSALGEKSNYTGKHVDNVALLSEIIAEGINNNQTIFKDKSFNKEQMEEIKLAAWLHDIGKITTPEYVVDKAMRLETIHDRVHEVEARFEILKRDIEISYLKNEIDEAAMKERLRQIEEDVEFIHKVNSGDTFMTDDLLQRVQDLAAKGNITINNREKELLSENEAFNLSIKKGTLTDDERDSINNHVVMSYKMLKTLPFPKKFANVARLAGSHHKTIDNKGYCAKEIMDLPMTTEDKILAVADIFEALSAHDRPYRGPNTLSQIAKIMMFMVQDKHLDRDIVRIFFEEKMYQKYLDENFLPDQIDEITIDFSTVDYK